MQIQSLGGEEPPEEGMAIHSSILAWRIPWTEKSGGLHSTGSQRVEHDWSDLTAAAVYKGEENGNSLQYSCLENSMDGGAWLATVHGVAKSRTRLSNFTFFLSIVSFGGGNGNPLQCSCLENPMDGGAWWATVYGVAKSQTRLSDFSFFFSFLFSEQGLF